ncbi:uncharacterized protein LOC131331574 [Rhododendron vialii]|uniref:uncharacterized protein LOC131331574 n=1 Tax=Rhododendron vialii TaxID=182163 RepID=UPI00265FC408|nr:uncharacterized protein LOC131331574 [Rhododendron vialii]
MSGKDKTSVVGIWMGLMILCLVVGEVSAISCELKCFFKCFGLFDPYGCFIGCDCRHGGSVVSTAASRCAFTCAKEKCTKFAADSKKLGIFASNMNIKGCAQSCASGCHLT